jgi:hypothetical protein
MPRPVFHQLRRRYITIVLILLSQLAPIKNMQTPFLPFLNIAVMSEFKFPMRDLHLIRALLFKLTVCKLICQILRLALGMYALPTIPMAPC